MFGKVLQTVGIGGAKVDTILASDQVTPGGVLEGTVVVTGGSARQTLRGTRIELVSRCYVEVKDGRQLTDIVVASGVIRAPDVDAGETAETTFAVDVPEHTPLSVGSSRTFLRTTLDVAFGKDAKDTDAVRIVPTPAMALVFTAAETIGLRLKEAVVEYHPRRKFPFVQEFDFWPAGGGFRVKEVEMRMTPLKTGVQVELTVDRRGGLFRVGGERRAKFSLRGGDLEVGAAAEVLWRHIAALS